MMTDVRTLSGSVLQLKWAHSTRKTVYSPKVGTYDGAGDLGGGGACGCDTRLHSNPIVKRADRVEVIRRRSAVISKRTAGNGTTS